MLSIIICSVNPGYLAAVSKNIQETIGLEYELLSFDNRHVNSGICRVYNQQAQLARYPFLLFLHEDIIIRTNNWGKILTCIFDKNKNCGMVGVAGSNYKSRMYSGWYTGVKELDAFHILHDTHGTEIEMIHDRPEKSNLYGAVCLDGVFLATTRDIWYKTKFNEEKLRGFHYYDLDFSLRASLISSIYITMEIGINHITTGGDFGDKWIKETFIFHDYFKKLLPQPSPPIIDKELEICIANTWLDRLKINQISYSNKIKWIQQQKLLSYPQLYYGIIKFLFYKPLGLQKLHHHFKKI